MRKPCVMVINVTNCKSKMVIILATSLALGVSAVAACVVPWLYCKPADGADDNREATAIGDDSDSQSRLNNEHDCTISTVGLEVNGFNFIKMYITRRSTVNPDIAQLMSRQNETANSTSFNECLPQNPMKGESRLPIRADDIRDQSRRDVDPRTTGVANFVSTAANTKNSENPTEDPEESRDGRSSEAAITNSGISESNAEYPDSTEPSSSNATEDTEESRDAQFLKVVVRDTQIVESPLSNSEPTEPSFMLKIDVDDFQLSRDAQQTTQSSNPTGESSTDTQQTQSSNATDESSIETTLTASSGVSGLDHSESNIETDEQSAEKTRSSNIAKFVESTSRIARISKVESTGSESSNPRLSVPKTLERGSIDRSKEVATTPLRTSQPSDPKGDSSIEKTDGPSTSRESERSLDPAKDSAIAVVESSKISEDLDTISEVSSCSESSEEPSPRAASSRTVLPTSSKTPDLAQPVSQNHQNSDVKKMSRRARVASRLSNGFRRFFHGIRLDRTPRSSREDLPRELHTESVHSVSAGEKLPAGHSTLILEDQQLLNNIRRRRSMISYMCLPKPLEDPRIFLQDHRNEAESGLHGNEKPLDLSIHASSVCDKDMKDGLASEEKDFDGTSDDTRQVLREVEGYLRERILRTSEDGTSRSGSLKFKRDENQNFSSVSSTAANDANFYENRERIIDSEANFNFPKISDGKPKMRSLKNIFKFGNKNRSKDNDKVSYVGRRKTGANDVPAEFQRNSVGMSSKPGEDLNANFESTASESRVDSHSYQELEFGIVDDEINLREPCTEL